MKPRRCQISAVIRKLSVATASILTAQTLSAPAALPAEPLAAAELAPGVTFEVLGISRINDDAVQLDFSVANESGEAVDLTGIGVMEQRSLSLYADTIELLDFVHKTAYGVGRARDCLCTKLDHREKLLPAGERAEFWAQYGAPPGGVDEIAVEIPGMPPILGVPIGERASP